MGPRTSRKQCLATLGSADDSIGDGLLYFTPEAKIFCRWDRTGKASYSADARGDRPASRPTRPVEQNLGNGYRLRYNPWVASSEARAEILRGRQVVWTVQNCRLRVGGRAWPGLDRPRDITGNGVPDLVVGVFPARRGMGDTYVLELGTELRELAYLPNAVSFEDLDSDGVAEVRVCDGTYRYWGCSGAESPCPAAVLRWTPTGYRPAHDLMRGRPLPDAELERRLRHLTALPESRAHAVLVGTMLDLIYTGNCRQADRFLVRAIPDQPRREQFRQSLLAKMSESPYAPPWATLPCASAAPR